MTGTIKKIIKDKGFGFIAPDDGSDEIFFHRSRLAPKVYFEDLREGAEVQFETPPGDKVHKRSTCACARFTLISL